MSLAAFSSIEQKDEPHSRRRSAALRFLRGSKTLVESVIGRNIVKDTTANSSQVNLDMVEASTRENVVETTSTNSDHMQASQDDLYAQAARQLVESESLAAQGTRNAGSSSPSTRFYEVPQRFTEFPPLPSPSSTRSGSPERFPNGAPFFVNLELPLPSPSSTPTRSPSPLQEYHYNAAHFHNESAAYHDESAELFDSAAGYHDNAVEYHQSRARFHRVQFHSPIASYFPVSVQVVPEYLLPCTMQESVKGSIHGSPDIQGDDARFSITSTLRPSSMMSASDPKHSSLPHARDFAQPATEGSNTNKATDTDRPIKWIIRAKTPSFSSDSEAEVYNGPSVFMNADKGWEPDVKKVKNKSKTASRQGSSSSAASTVKHVADVISGAGLQVPSLDTQDIHSRTSSGISGLSRITTISDLTGGTSSLGFLDQDDLMARMLNPEQQVTNAENHVKAMKEALAKAYRDREDAEDRTAVAEALLKSSLELQANERGETVLMEKFRLNEEKLNVSRALLETARERNVEYEDRTMRAESLIDRMVEKVKVGVPAIVNSANAEVAEVEERLNEAMKRAEKAEQNLKETITGLQGDLTQACRDAIERADVAEKRAQTAEELQEKDRLWTIDADKRAVHAENDVTELRAELARAHSSLAEQQTLLMRERSRTDKAEKDLKDAESELEAFENRSIEFEKEVYEYKTKFYSLKKYADKLQEHHNGREKEFMACNDEWKNKEEEFVKQTMEQKFWGDQVVAKYEDEVKKSDEVNQEMTQDKEIVIARFAGVFAKMKETGEMLGSDELNSLFEWAAKEPRDRKGKESIAVVREKARRTLEGLAFTPSLDSGAFDSNFTTGMKLPNDMNLRAAKEMRTSPIEDVDRKLQMGMARLPECSGGKWYAMSRTTKE